MKLHRWILAFCIAVPVVAGLFIIIKALTHDRQVCMLDTDRLVHRYYAPCLGEKYVELFKEAVEAKMCLGVTIVSHHVTVGLSLVLIGLLLAVFLYEVRGRRDEGGDDGVESVGGA